MGGNILNWKRRFRSIALLLVMSLLLVIFTGCDDVEQRNNDLTAQTSVTNSEETGSTPKPGRPREDLEVEIAEGINAIYGLMRVHFIDVGQADSTFIELGNGQTMLIDAGLGGDDVVNYIRNLQYSSIDFVVATHPHDDHIGGMATVLDSFEIGKMYMPRQEHTISAFTNMLDVIENKEIELHEAKAGVNIKTSGIIKIDILAPFAESYSNLNNCSAVVKLTYGETVMLFTGDAEQVIETQLLDSDIDADVLKVGHHGAGSASSRSFIKEVSPEVAVISCGENNKYGHPHADTLAILNEVGANIYRTDEQGTIQVTADQYKKITVDKKASTVKENAPPAVIYTESEESAENNSVVNDSQSDVVYRTKTGSKYHRSGCSYLKSKIETTVSEAQSMGLGPCSRCIVK